jgi:hypothetical protein
MSDLTIFVTFRPPDCKDRDTEPCPIEAWREHFNKHVFRGEIWTNGNKYEFVWDHDIGQTGGRLCYMGQFKDLTRDWTRMVKLLKTGGFVTEKNKDEWHCRPALKSPNWILINIWRICHIFDRIFWKSTKKAGSKKRASPKQDDRSVDSVIATTEKPYALPAASSVGPRSQKPSKSTSSHTSHPHHAADQRWRVQKIGGETMHFLGALENNGRTLVGARLPNLNVTVPEPRSELREVTQSVNLDPDETIGGMPNTSSDAHMRVDKDPRNTSNNVLIQGCQIGRIVIGR